MPHSSRIRAQLAFTLLLIASCGGRTIEPAGSSQGGSAAVSGEPAAGAVAQAGGATSAGSAGSTSAGGERGAGAPSTGAGGLCRVDLAPAPRVLEFLIDSSLSMKTELVPGLTRWNALRAALSETFSALDEHTLSGLIFYPSVQVSAGEHAGDSWCFLRYEAAPLAPLSVRQRELLLQALSGKEPLGATPTHDSYRYALSRLENSAGARHLLLITDGPPTYGLGCTGTGDTPVDTEPLIAEAGSASARAIETFVVALGSAENAGWLSRLALAGGTGRPGCSESASLYCHYQVGGGANPTVALRDALTDIISRTQSCDYDLPNPSLGGLVANDQALVLLEPDSGSPVVLNHKSEGPACPEAVVLEGSMRRLKLCEPICRRAASSPGRKLALAFSCELGP